MELRQYFKILLGKWWIILSLTLMGFTYSLVFSYSRTPIYESISTYVTALDSSLNTPGDPGSSIYGFETLTGREQRIFVTYCGILTSQTVIKRAYELLAVNTTELDVTKYSVNCSNLPDTNILSLTVTGPSPALVEKLNEAIGTVGVSHTNSLYTLFLLQNLDPVELEPKPISPKYPQNAALGTGMGLMVGIALAFLIEYFQSPSSRLEALSIRHNQMGVYNERYFRQRFEQEINRAHARNRPIGMALLYLIPNEDFRLLPETSQTSLYRAAALMIEDRLGKDHIVAYIRPQTLGILLAETPAHQAQEILERLHAEIRTHHFEVEGYSTSFVANSGLVASSGAALDYSEMIDKAAEALKVANKTGENIIHLIRATPLPFVMPGMEEEQNPADGTLSFDGLGWEDESAEIIRPISTPSNSDMPTVTTSLHKTTNGQGAKAVEADSAVIEKSLLSRLRDDLIRANRHDKDESEIENKN